MAEDRLQLDIRELPVGAKRRLRVLAAQHGMSLTEYFRAFVLDLLASLEGKQP